MSEIAPPKSRFAYFLLGVLLTLGTGVAAFLLAERRALVHAHSRPVPEHSGPWGIVEAEPLPLANPDGILPDQETRLQMPRWYFEDYNEARLAELFDKCDLRPVQKKILMDKQFWTVTSNACILTPPEPVIWSLSSRARGIIYTALADCPSNYAQCFPFRFPPQSFEEYLKDSGLDEQDVHKVKRLAYTNAGAVCFADLKTIRDLLKPDEFD